MHFLTPLLYQSRANKEKTRALKQQVIDLQQQLADLNALADARSMKESLVDIDSDSTPVRL
jgi:hypothetical protein